MLGDVEHPVSFRFDPEIRGQHVHVRVRAGQAGMRADCGTLVMRREEWAALRWAMQTAPFPQSERVSIPQARGRVEWVRELAVEPFECTPETRESGPVLAGETPREDQ